jgi:hypothetical protein
MAFPRLGGQGIGLNVASGLVPNFAGTPPVAAGLTNLIQLAAAEIWNLPSGTYMVMPGPYTSVQFLDPITGTWRTINAENSIQPIVLDSDGGNFRLANLTGTPVGGFITNAGSGLTNGFGTVTITPSAGSSVWQSVVGGAINSTGVITAGGSGYLFPPILIVDAPPAGGIQATATCTISGGAVNAATFVNQGAGYTTAPNVTVVNDPRDTVGSGAIVAANTTLVGSGTLTAMVPTNPGNAVTAVPTFTFSPASTIAATAVMNFVATGLTVTGGGVAVPAGSFGIIANGMLTATRASNVAGPIADVGLTQERIGVVQLNISGGVVQGSGNIFLDNGFGFQAVPGFGLVTSSGVAPTTGVNITPTVGGITDTSYVQRI